MFSLEFLFSFIKKFKAPSPALVVFPKLDICDADHKKAKGREQVSTLFLEF